MGMVIFTKSGTFKPSDYSLRAGDTVNLVIVGGGQGGTAYDSSAGGNGATSSFGSFLTAAGGSSSSEIYSPGNGGFILPAYGIADSRGNEEFNGMFAGGGNGTTFSDTDSVIYGGNGYGAGGGGGSSSINDGKPGEIKFGSAILTDSSVAVSVGGGGGGGVHVYRSSGIDIAGTAGTTSNGGTGGYSDGIGGGMGGYNNKKGSDAYKISGSYSGYAGGGGAGGCVIVFW